MIKSIKKQAITTQVMGIIRQLSAQEIQKIAAGEVVERPASIVKELVENSLDARATSIDIYVEEGGKSRIRVVDNGGGMQLDDLRMCILPHATSKITQIDDLTTLVSYGFRGEALASIAAVSRFTIKSRYHTEQTGYQLRVESDMPAEEFPIGMAVGTDIEITDLFYNVPARQKFLKTIETEWRQIIQLMQSFALAHLQVHFRLYHFGQLVYNWPAVDDLSSRAMQVFDDSTSRALIEISAENDYARVHGVISNHQFMRYARTHIFVFANNRWVRNNGISKALLKAYANVLQPGKFPAAFLFIDVQPHAIDVNTHPRKEEVQFEHAHKIEQLVFQTVQQQLGAQVTARQVDYDTRFRPAQLPQESSVYVPSLPAPTYQVSPAMTAARTGFESLLYTDPLITTQAQTVSEPVQQQQALVGEVVTIIGQLKKTYILVERADGLWMVDQHAAHERILYETFRSRFEQVASTRLLFPARITMDQQEIDLLTPYMGLLQQEGLEIEQFGQGQLVVYATPTYAKNLDFTELLSNCVNNIREIAHLEPDRITAALRERVHAMMACKSAIKAGDSLDMQQMHELVQSLEKTPNKLTCPHGRPTAWIVTIYEIERKFKRLV